MQFSLGSLALAGAFSALVGAFPQIAPRASTACNNSPTLCDRAYNKITHLGGHNSAFLRDESTSNSISGNHYYNATTALSAGLRLLQAQVHKENNALQLCHTSCTLLDAGPLQDWLSGIKSWMDSNPNEVVTILLVNSDKATADEFASAFKGAGLDKFGYTPLAEGGEWPTLQKMISDGKRMVSFVTDIQASQTAPYLLSEFNYVFETPFDVSELNGFNCTLDRPKKAESASNAVSNGMLGLVNHFKYSGSGQVQLPDVDNINIVNDAGTSTDGNIGKHIDTCKNEWKTNPTYVLIDFFSEGNPLDAVDSMNGISDATGRTKAKAKDGSLSGASGPVRSSGAIALVAFLSAALLLI